MTIQFKSIKINNFLSFGEAFVELNDRGYTLVNGINENPDDLAKSNGAGKSTIFEAISWVLTGETIRGTKDVKNINTTEGTLVELNFNIDNTDYRLIRSKEHSTYKTNLKIFINGEDKSGKGIRDSEALLKEYIPDLTSSLLGSVILLGQGLPQRFTNNTPSGRKEVLEKLSKSDFMIEDLKERISLRKSALAAVLREKEDTILKLDSTKELLESQIKENKIKLESMNSNDKLDELINSLILLIDDCQIKIDTYNNELENLRTEYQTVANTKTDYSNKITDLTNFKSEFIIEQSNIKTKIANEKTDYNNLTKVKQTDIENKWNIIINELYKNYTDISSDMQSKKSELIKLQNIKDTCPTCGQKLPGVFKPDTTELEKVISELEIKSNSLLEDYNNAKNNKQNELNEFIKTCSNELEVISHKYNNDLENIQSKLNEKDLEINEIKSKINSVDIELNNITSKANNIKIELNALVTKQNSYNEKITTAKLEKESLESNKQAAENIIATNTLKISEIETNKTEIINEKTELEKHIEVVNSMNTSITRDFRGYLLSNIITYINNKSKEYSMEIFGTDKIVFEQDKNNISISYDNKLYENLSGGEKQKIDLIVQFAIRDMLCKYLNFSSNIIVLDEIFDNLDDIGCQKVLNLIATNLNDVDSIFIITHHSDISIPYDTEITVIKGIDKISRIK